MNGFSGDVSGAGKHGRQEEKGTTFSKMIRQSHRLGGPEFDHAPGVSDGQESRSDRTAQVNRTVFTTQQRIQALLYGSHLFFFFNMVIRVTLMAQTVKSPFTKRETQIHSWGGIPWRREWLPTAVFLPGEIHGQRSLEGYSPWGRKQSEHD